MQSGSSTRELRCIVLDETDVNYKVRVELGTSTVPKARVAGIQRQTAEENAALLAGWLAAKAPKTALDPAAPVDDGPIPPADRTEALTIDANALLQQYSFAQLQDGLDYEAVCPSNVEWCQARVRAVAPLHSRYFGLHVGDLVLGLNGQRFARGPAGDQQLQTAITGALTGRRQTLHLLRGAERLDITYNVVTPPQPQG